MEDERTIFLYRNLEGVRQKFRFTVDKNMTILGEEPCQENGLPFSVSLDRTDPSIRDAALEATPYVKDLKARGFEYHITDGKVHIDKIPPMELKIAQFFIPDAACPFENCEHLRAKYLEERKAMEDKEGKCSSCDIGTLQRKYTTVIKKYLNEKAIYDHTPKIRTGNPGVPRPAKGAARRIGAKQ
jgi:hypothetical protein